MKKFGYILISVLAALMLLSVAACGGDEGETSENVCAVTYYIFGSEYASQDVEKGTAVEGSAPASGSGYTFDGWYTDPSLTQKAAFPYTVEGDISFYGAWQESSFKLTFDTKDGTAIPEQTHYKNDYLTPPSAPAREGYRFTGWYTDEECTKAYEFVNKQMPAHDLTLYAGWQELLAIDFDPKLPEGQSETFRRYVGEREGLTVEDPVCSGYIFLGWYVSNEDHTDEMRVPFENPNLVFTESMQLYGKWRQAMRGIRLYCYSEDVAVGDSVLLVDEGAKYPQLPRPTHSDEAYYVFDGWFLDEYCTEPVLFDGENATRVSGDVVENGRITLYAGWHRDPRYALITFTVAGDTLGSVFAEKGKSFREALSEQLSSLTLPENTVLDGYYSPVGFTYTDDSLVVMDMELAGNLYTQGITFETVPAATEEELPTVKMTGYTGTASKLYLPRFYEGKEVVEIADSVFAGKGFSEIVGLERVRVIGASAFQGCSSIKAIDLSGAEIVGDSAFENCSALKEVTLGEDIMQFGKNVFNGCAYAGETDASGNVLYGTVLAKVAAKAEITLDGNVKTVASEAAKDNTTLQIFTANGVSYVCKSAFEGCTSLTTAVISGSAAYVGERAFYGCEKLGTPPVATASILPIAIRTTNAYRAAQIDDYAFYGAAFSNLNFGGTVRSIGAHAFENGAKLTAVTIPITVVSVGESAFENCAALEQILIGNSSVTDETQVYLTSVGARAFAGAAALKYVVVRTHLVEDEIFTAGEDWLPIEGDYKFYVSNRPVPIDTSSQYYGNGMMTYKEIFRQEMPAYRDKILSMSEIKPIVKLLVEEYSLTAAAADSGLNVLSLVANRLQKDGKPLEITEPSNDFIAEATYENSHWTYVVDTVTRGTPDGDVVEPVTYNGALYRLGVGTYYVNFTLINGYNCTTATSLRIVVTET